MSVTANLPVNQLVAVAKELQTNPEFLDKVLSITFQPEVAKIAASIIPKLPLSKVFGAGNLDNVVPALLKEETLPRLIEVSAQPGDRDHWTYGLSRDRVVKQYQHEADRQREKLALAQIAVLVMTATAWALTSGDPTGLARLATMGGAALAGTGTLLAHLFIEDPN